YFTMGDVMATLSAAGALAAIGGVSFGAGYIGGAAAAGASGEEILGMFGDFGAGFASGVSGGYLTDVYEAYSGKKVEPTQGALWGAGTVTGIGVSFLLGMKLPQLAATAVGPMKWVATAGMAAQTGLDVYGAATATGNLYQSYQDNGQWEVQDAWNLLAYVPFVGMALGVTKGIGAARKVKGGVPGADDVLATQSTRTRVVGQCFVAGTEILTTEGIKNIEDIRVGDWVIADDPITPGGVVAHQVLETFVRETDALYDLYVDGEVISTTGEHPFWVPDLGWVEAKDLTVGSLLQTADGRVVDVDGVQKREGKFEVYNFRVEGIPTYFVSELGILVHNANCVTIYKAPQPGMGEKLLNDGFHPEGFFDPDGDNLAYFAKERELAEIYEQFYKDGILEVDIPKDVYDRRIKRHEKPYQGGPLIEIPIPQEDFDVLNDAVRRLVK
ncbi:MAG: polymorphic toxin-type HINT domain-containing protein, partial [Actinomycetota bacterium]